MAAASATYFKCVDAKGAISMQQTPCAGNSAQEAKNASAQTPTAADRARAIAEVERDKDTATARQRKEAAEREAQAAQASEDAQRQALAKAERKRKQDLDECLNRKIAAVTEKERILRYQQSLPESKKALRYVVPNVPSCDQFLN